MTDEEKNITEYRIVRGQPNDVENKVNNMLKNGWHIKGDLMTFILPESKTIIVMQNMVQY